MRSLSVLCTALLFTALASGAPSTPAARDVVVRGGRDLGDLLSRATSSAWKDGSAARPVALVVDVTPHTAAAEKLLVDALESIGTKITHLSGDWRIGALGKRLSTPVRHPSALTAKVPAVLAEETSEVNTFRALGRSLAGFSARGGVVVYLADWRFEDDDDLEGLISRLQGRGQVLRVIGSEGCFGRAWNDGLPRMMALGDAKNDPHVGRNPFGSRRPDAPWHGGDTAYPHAPYSFGSTPWKTEFPVSIDDRIGDRGGLEELGERLGRMKSSSVSLQRYPLASSFGPYGLMRAAAETGGRYYLYSWNPEGRVDVVYDYGKCNIFQPDLRSRREILATVRSDPIASAMIRAWRKLADPALRIVDVSPPFTPGGAPDEIERVPPGQGLQKFWPEKADHQRFLSAIEKHIRALDRVGGSLSRALSAPARTHGPWPRYRADAVLLLHTVRVLGFEMREARAVARTVPADAWVDPDTIPGIAAEDWIRPGNDPEDIRTTSTLPLDQAAGEKILQARRGHLRTYGGTPFGETVARNSVVTWRIRKQPSLKSLSSGGLGRTPSESDRNAPETPGTGRPGTGGSTGGGPSSGR